MVHNANSFEIENAHRRIKEDISKQLSKSLNSKIIIPKSVRDYEPVLSESRSRNNDEPRPPKRPIHEKIEQISKKLTTKYHNQAFNWTFKSEKKPRKVYPNRLRQTQEISELNKTFLLRTNIKSLSNTTNSLAFRMSQTDPR